MRTCLPAITLALLLITAPASAQTSTALVLLPWQEDVDVQATASFFGYHGDTKAADRNLNLFWYRTAGRYRPVAEPVTWAVGWDLSYLEVDTSDPVLPSRLVNQAIAGAVKFAETDGWEFGGTFGVGYAGTAPFNDGDAWYALGSVMARTKLDENSTLTLFVDYNGNRTIFPDLPLPGVAYSRYIDKTLRFSVGFPVNSLDWTPDEHWSVTVRWIVPVVFNVRGGYKINEQWEVFALYRSESEAYQVSGDSNRRRLFFEQQRAELGVQYTPCPHASVLAGIGYAFDQRFERGWDARDTDLVTEVSDEPYVRVALSFEF